MRKFIIFLVLIVVFMSVVVLSAGSLNAVISFSRESFSHVSDQLNLGFVLQEYEQETIKYSADGQTVGECLKISGTQNLNKICDQLGLMIKTKYYVGNIYMIEGFSALLKYKTSSQNNVQIAVLDDDIIIASPIIFGSY